MAERTGSRRTRRAKSDRKRMNGTGSVYPFRAGYRAAFTWRDDAGLHRRVLSAPTADAAHRALSRLRDQHDEGTIPAGAGTVAAYLNRWVERSRHDVRPSSWRQRDAVVRTHLVPAIGRIGLARLTPSDVEGMTGGMVAAGKSPTTAVHARIILRRALADAVRDGLVPRNVAALARPPRKVRHELAYLDTAALRRLLDAVAVGWRLSVPGAGWSAPSPRIAWAPWEPDKDDDALGPVITLAATTGLRQGEILGLRWQDVDNQARRLTVRRSLVQDLAGRAVLAEPKTPKSRRTIDLPVRAVAALEVERERQEARRKAAGTAWNPPVGMDGLVFSDGIGSPLRGPSVTHGFQRRCATLGLPSVPFHALRHSAASTLLAAGVPLKTVSETLGHSTITLTADTYGHLAPELRRDAADAMDRALS